MDTNLLGFLILAHPNNVKDRVPIDKTLVLIISNELTLCWCPVYVDGIIFVSTMKSISLNLKSNYLPIESNKPLVKDEDGVEVDVHEYRSMIGSLMYLTASRPDIMFAVCACARFQVTPKASHLHASQTGNQQLLGYQFLSRRLISWQCKKQTIMANSTIEAEYVAAAHCCGQMLQEYIILSDAEIYAGLATLGAAMDQGEGSAQPAEPHHTPVDPISSTSQPPHLSSPPYSPHPSPPHSPHQSPPHSPH
ncbi:hypothetical protein Tco_1175289 [Tanacetum coccineum]